MGQLRLLAGLEAAGGIEREKVLRVRARQSELGSPLDQSPLVLTSSSSSTYIEDDDQFTHDKANKMANEIRASSAIMASPTLCVSINGLGWLNESEQSESEQSSMSCEGNT